MTKEQFKEKLEPIHRTFWQKAYRKLSAKMSALLSSLKRRSIENEVECTITKIDIREMFYEIYGKGCKYCNKRLDIRTIACDHIIPLAKKGSSIRGNLQLICKTCNTRKGPLDEKDFKLLIQLIGELPEELNKYVMRKLAKGGRF